MITIFKFSFCVGSLNECGCRILIFFETFKKSSTLVNFTIFFLKFLKGTYHGTVFQ